MTHSTGKLSVIVVASLFLSNVLLVPGSLSAAPPSFMGLGDLAGGNPLSLANGISADASTVVGISVSAFGYEAFRWTATGGMVGLGDWAGGSFFSNATAVSADGSVVVGSGTPASGYDEAFRWTQSVGMVGLGDLAGGDPRSYAQAVSADGSVVVGSGTTDLGYEAYRWTQSGGLIPLGDLPGGDLSSEAHGVSADGLIVAGSCNPVSGGTAPFRWTSGGGMTSLGHLPGSSADGTFGISADGSTVVGYGRSSLGNQAFRWTIGTGIVGLGDLPGGEFKSYAFAASADGSVVVGQGASDTSEDDAFIWDSTHGMRSLQSVLVNDLHLDLTGWTLYTAKGVSSDGLTIAGTGINPLGFTEAWIAHIPEPSTAAFLLLVIVLTKARCNQSSVRPSSR